jgi:hypothetical protein
MGLAGISQRISGRKSRISRGYSVRYSSSSAIRPASIRSNSLASLPIALISVTNTPWRARRPPMAPPAGSASARARVKSPESRIAFPPTTLPARPEDGRLPLHQESAQAPWNESAPPRLFTRPRELLGGRRRCCALLRWTSRLCRRVGLSDSQSARRDTPRGQRMRAEPPIVSHSIRCLGQRAKSPPVLPRERPSVGRALL